MKTSAEITLEVARDNAQAWELGALPWPGAALTYGLRRADRAEMWQKIAR